jgi:hypothetical protein
MGRQPACFPAGRIERKPGDLRLLPPILAGIRANKTNLPTFPCNMHSGFGRRLPHECGACFTVAGAARLGLRMQIAGLAFPV